MSKTRLLSVWQNVSWYLNFFLRVKQHGRTFFFKETSWAHCLTPMGHGWWEQPRWGWTLVTEKMAQLNIKHHSGLGVQSNLGDKGNFSVFVVIEGIFLLIPSQIWSHWVDYSRNEADLKSSISWDPSFWLLQCEPSRRHGRARCDKEWAVESCSPDIIPRHHPQLPEDNRERWNLPQVLPQTVGAFRGGIFCVHSLWLVRRTWWVSMATLEHLTELRALRDSSAHGASSRISVLCAQGLS